MVGRCQQHMPTQGGALDVLDVRVILLDARVEDPHAHPLPQEPRRPQRLRGEHRRDAVLGQQGTPLRALTTPLPHPSTATAVVGASTSACTILVQPQCRPRAQPATAVGQMQGQVHNLDLACAQEN